MVHRERRIEELEAQMVESGFWDRPDRAREVIEEVKWLRSWVEPWAELDSKATDLVDLAELLREDPDVELEREWSREVLHLEKGLGELELRTML